MQLKTIRLALYGAIVGVGLIGAGLYASMAYFAPSSQFGQPTTLIGGPFRMTDTTGKTVTQADLIGHPSLMFFGYTYCPDVCPTTLTEATDWLKTLGDKGKNLQVYFVTVDPERDTPAKIADYLTAFDPGTPEQTAAILKAYRVFARKVPQKDSPDYLMDHSAAVYMLDTQGRFVGALTYQEPEDKALAKIRDLIARG
jgi:protein SCO1/2